MNSKWTICLIAALSENRVIGHKGKIPWYIPEDLKRFKRLTQNHAVIMGRKTYESIGKRLPNRTNIIVTRDPQFMAKNCVVVHSINDAIMAANRLSPGEIFFIGGGVIFDEAIKLADRLYLTIVKGTFEGDAYFPIYSDFSKKTYSEKGKSGEYEYEFVDLIRK